FSQRIAKARMVGLREILRDHYHVGAKRNDRVRRFGTESRPTNPMVHVPCGDAHPSPRAQSLLRGRRRLAFWIEIRLSDAFPDLPYLIENRGAVDLIHPTARGTYLRDIRDRRVSLRGFIFREDPPVAVERPLVGEVSQFRR